MENQRPTGLSRLRFYRLEAGLTLKEVADLVGMSEAMLSLVERRKRRLRGTQKVAFARALGVRVIDLFEPEELTDEAS